MNKSLNIFAFLFIIVFVNSTKMISYSDVVSSLVQLNASPNAGLAQLNGILEGFQSSNKLLNSLALDIKENCQLLGKRGNTTVGEISHKIKNYENTIEALTKSNMVLATETAELQVATRAALSKIPKTKSQMDAVRNATARQERIAVENVNILKRLRNIAVDELQGLTQKKTDMSAIHVTVISFIQTDDFKTQLKSLLSNSDSSTKALISTLIMMTQSAGKSTFANPQTVKNIVNFIEKIILKTQERVKTLFREQDANLRNYAKLISNSRQLVSQLKETIQSKVQSRQANTNNVLFLRGDIVFLRRSVDRKVSRNQFNAELCGKQQKLVDTHKRRYEESVKQLNGLKDVLSR